MQEADLIDYDHPRTGGSAATAPRGGVGMRQRSSDGMGFVYSRAERLSDAAVHVMGVIAALMAAPVLITLAILWRGDGTTVLASLVYAATLIAMLSCSALYHLASWPEWKGVFRRMDHSAIYLKIAGTYTPFAVLTGAHAGPLLAGLWGAAAVGAAIKIFDPDRFRFATVGLCLLMGWAGVLVGDELLAGLSPQVFKLMLLGGLIYTGGVVFFLWQALPFHNTIWHVFVLAATAIFYAAVLIQLADGSMTLQAAGVPPPAS
jgi:hemolysin III